MSKLQITKDAVNVLLTSTQLAYISRMAYGARAADIAEMYNRTPEAIVQQLYMARRDLRCNTNAELVRVLMAAGILE